MTLGRKALFRHGDANATFGRSLAALTVIALIMANDLIPPQMANVAYANVPAAQTPGLTITKMPSTSSVDVAGQIVTNTFTVTNTGNVTLTGVGVTDIEGVGTGPLTTPTCVGLTNPTTTCSGNAVTLAPNQVATFTNTYTVTQADLDAGIALTDSATATGFPPSDVSYTTPDPGNAQVNVNQNPDLTITKSASPTTVNTVNQVVTYTFLVTNTGNVTLSDVKVNDTVTSPPGDTLTNSPSCVEIDPGESGCSGGSTTLAPGQVATFTATQKVNQGDLDVGEIKDSATASGSDSASTVTSLPATTGVRVQQHSRLLLFATADVAFFSASGQKISFTFEVQNAGNVTLHHPGVITGLTGISRVECSGQVISPGSAISCRAQYSTRLADVVRGDVSLTAVAVGWTDDNHRVASAPSGVIVPAIKKTVEVTG